MALARAAWLAAVRLVMSAQVVETYPLVRVIVENARYALHLAKDSTPPAREAVAAPQRRRRRRAPLLNGVQH
jgi:hypothetical protein